MDSTKAVFRKVAIMPPAMLRWSAGTEFIISARFREANAAAEAVERYDQLEPQ